MRTRDGRLPTASRLLLLRVGPRPTGIVDTAALLSAVGEFSEACVQISVTLNLYATPSDKPAAWHEHTCGDADERQWPGLQTGSSQTRWRAAELTNDQLRAGESGG